MPNEMHGHLNTFMHVTLDVNRMYTSLYMYVKNMFNTNPQILSVQT